MTKVRGVVAYIGSLAVFAAVTMVGAAMHYEANRATFDSQGLTYRALWAQAGVIYAYLFLPIGLAAWSAMAAKVEHDDRNLQRMAGYGVLLKHVLPGKLVGIAVAGLVGSIVYWIVMCVTGLLLGFGVNSELLSTLVLAVTGALGSATVMVLMLHVSFRVQGFAFPVAVGFVGSVIGFTLMLISKPLAIIWPFCLPGNLMFVRSVSDVSGGDVLVNVVSSLLWSAVGLIILYRFLRRRDF